MYLSIKTLIFLMLRGFFPTFKYPAIRDEFTLTTKSSAHYFRSHAQGKGKSLLSGLRHVLDNKKKGASPKLGGSLSYLCPTGTCVGLSARLPPTDPREVWTDHPVWGLGFGRPRPQADLGGDGRRPRREPPCGGEHARAAETRWCAPPPE